MLQRTTQQGPIAKLQRKAQLLRCLADSCWHRQKRRQQQSPAVHSLDKLQLLWQLARVLSGDIEVPSTCGAEQLYQQRSRFLARHCALEAAAVAVSAAAV